MIELGSPVVALPRRQIQEIIRRALDEDAPWGDITSDALIPAETCASGVFMVKEAGIVCGLDVVAAVFVEVDPGICFEAQLHDGSRVAAGAVAATVSGAARAILTAERTALNLMQRMSGIATATARYVDAVAGTGAVIVDTRKTAPGLRLLDKYAVRCGGGENHRFSLSDGVLVKDNHLAMVNDGGASISERLRAVRRSAPHTIRVEVEVDRLDQIETVLAGDADIVLLDNMPPAELRRAVDLIAGRALTEASGGITLESVSAVARAGVDLISVGALTHSVRALDIGLDLERVPR
jgi:nicotinate-nucleotide pyrophosphorylase (carboxylating)